ncbi:MAG: putative endonuclease [Clostridia bacterium]|nr:putative endonuclease [Clostridia bacterium]MDN5322727.1 putative endonuclease [Clostridia bacterium]
MSRDLGKQGEQLALRKIKSLGYKILEQNFRCKIGEIDLIAMDKNTLVFIEVRSKSTDKFGLPQETVNCQKQKKIRDVARYYLVKNKLTTENCRFDVIGIVWNGKGKPEIEIIKNAF